jgi:hypothetical protein
MAGIKLTNVRRNMSQRVGRWNGEAPLVLQETSLTGWEQYEA